MVDVVRDADVFAKNLLTHSVVETGALVIYCGRSEIVEKEANEIEDGRRLEDDRIPTRW